MLLLVDNYDSFTYNIYQFLCELGAQVEVRRNDHLTAAQAIDMQPQAIVLSPGPCTPDKAGICLRLLEIAPEKMPILGVCLGLQAIGQAFGGRIRPAERPVHGECTAVHHNQRTLFADIANPLFAARYHSLVVDSQTLPKELEITARDPKGEIMALQHSARPIYGVQFHPESIATVDGPKILANFLSLAGWRNLLAVRVRQVSGITSGMTASRKSGR